MKQIVLIQAFRQHKVLAPIVEVSKVSAEGHGC